MKRIGVIIMLLFVTAWGTGCSLDAKQEDNLTGTEPEVWQEDSNVLNPEETVKEREAAAITEMDADYSEYFQHINGCAVLYDESANVCYFYNKEQCETEVSPLSTFKIVSALAGLEYGVLEDESSVMEYSGTKYPVEAWNGQLTLEEAFQTSCVWYFRQVIDCVGQQNMQTLLQKLQYGNRDLSEWYGKM